MAAMAGGRRLSYPAILRALEKHRRTAGAPLPLTIIACRALRQPWALLKYLQLPAVMLTGGASSLTHFMESHD